MKETLRSKVAIVTGAGQGVGAVTAAALADAGARVVVNDINPDRAEKVAAALRARGHEAVGLAADISNRFQCVNLIETTRATWGRLDILVNNAVVKPVGSVLTMDEWAWQRCLDVNLKGPFFMSQLVGRVMVDENQDRGGLIINIGCGEDNSDLAAGVAAYAASKGGLAAFSRACARELGPHDIGVFLVQPYSDGQMAAAGAELAAETAEAIVRLCREPASYSPGETILIGGRSTSESTTAT